MIGEVVIGGLIFALKGKRPYLERGWQKQCKTKTEWEVIAQERREYA